MSTTKISDLRQATFAQLSTSELYEILRLRTDVFVVEQNCPYPEVDGRDREPATLHFWYEEGERVVAAVRLLTEPGGSRKISRVVTATSHRDTGLASKLLAAAMLHCEGQHVLLHAQARLVDFYARFGFQPIGSLFDEDGMPHQRMDRPAS